MLTTIEFIIIFVVAVFVNNAVLSRLPGICPSLDVSKKISTAIGMGATVTFVLPLATMVTRLIQTYILVPIGLEFLQTTALILIIVTLAQMIEMVIKKISPVLYQTFGVFLPLITTNCCVLGATILVIQRKFAYAESLVHVVSTGIGFLPAMVIFAGIHEQPAKTGSTPHVMKDTPIALITAGVLAMAFVGFSGLAAT